MRVPLSGPQFYIIRKSHLAIHFYYFDLTISGFALLALIGAVLFYNKVTFKGKGADFVSDADRAQLATLLNCDASEVDALVKKNDQMNNSLRYSIFTNFIVRVYDATVGLVA